MMRDLQGQFFRDMRERGQIQDLASHAHGSGTVVFLLQELPDLPEVGQLEPAGLQTAGTRYTVTLAGHICEVIDRLEQREREDTLKC